MRRPRLDRLYASQFGEKPKPPPKDAGVEISSIAFGSFVGANDFACEWERKARGADKLLVQRGAESKDGRTTVVVRMWDDAGPFLTDATAGSSIRITLDVRRHSSSLSPLPNQTQPCPLQANIIDQVRRRSDSTSVFLHLSRPPTFETFPPHTPGTLKPFPRQVASLDDEHAQVFGYSWRVLRIKIRTRAYADAFLKDAEAADLPRALPVDAKYVDARYDATSRIILSSWLEQLDIRVAFQLEAILRDGVDPHKLLELQDDVEALSAGGPARAEVVLAAFADRIRSCEDVEEPEEIVLDSEPDRTSRKRKRHDDPPSSSAVSASSDNDDDVQIVVAALPYNRGLSAQSPSELSTAQLRLILLQAQSTDHLLLDADPLRLTRSITVTPTRLVLSGPSLADSNSVTRLYGRPEQFFSVAVRAEDGSKLDERRERDLIESRFKPLFEKGIDVAGRTLQFLAFSGSRLKSGTCFFMHPFEDDGERITPERVHVGVGNFAGTEVRCVPHLLSFPSLIHVSPLQTAKIPAKYSARIAQAFSSSKPTLALDPSQILRNDDIVSSSDSVHSDGVGLISPALAVDVCRHLRIDPKTSTCFQFRLGGSKGHIVSPLLRSVPY